MASPNATPVPSRGAQYATLAAALLGWMFDGFEMGLFPLIGKPALKDLLGSGAEATVSDQWFGVIMAVFLVGAASGGVFFGWLGDKVGRVRAMSLSILTYAIFTGLCGFATEAWHIAVLRFIASLGMGGEWSLGYFDGVFSHAGLKRAKSGDFRVQGLHGGTAQRATAPPGLAVQGLEILTTLPTMPCYARVDGVVRGDQFLLMELELVEPELFLELHADAPTALARAIGTRLV